MRKFGRFLILALILIGVFGATTNFTARAQTAVDVEAQRAKLQAELEAEERAIAEQTKVLQAKQKETATYQGEVNLLKAQIKRAETNIRAKKIAIERLDSDIAEREGRITVLQAKIKHEQDSLAELLRQTRDADTLSLAEIVLDDGRFSELFANLDDFQAVQTSLHRSFATLRDSQTEAKKEREALAERKDRELDAKATIEYEKKVVAKKESEKQILLSVSKNQEQAVKTVLTARQKRAAQIRSALFALRDTAAIPFGKALEFATAASQQTGVRPAFVLAILKQESNLGENVGTCNRVGDPPGKSWRVIMKPARDQAPYLRITTALGLNPETMPLSCPQAGGYGGAMGPAQFIPSTWELYQTKIATKTGHQPPNPWEPSDAIMASAIYLSELGGTGGVWSAEQRAAAKYYAGSRWATAGQGYANSVMALARDIQLNMIDPLQEI